MLRLTGKRDRLIGCVEKESILGKDISTCLPVSLNRFHHTILWLVFLEWLRHYQPQGTRMMEPL